MIFRHYFVVLLIKKNSFLLCLFLRCNKKKDYNLNEKEVLEVVAMNSPKNFHELKIHNYSTSVLLPDDLESFFVSWKDRIPSKSLSLIIIKDEFSHSLEMDENNMKIIEKYKNLGIIKNFETKNTYKEDND